MSIFAELKRRNVFRVGLAYVVLAWLLLQAGDTLAPALHLPEWINSALAFFLILGFPLAIFFAWAFEMTPEGIKLEKHVDRETSITPTTGRKLDRTVIVLLAAGLAYFAWQSQTAPEPEEVVETTSGRESIAVLPFENMSSDEEQEYFSDGLTEELLNLLAKIPELKVSSRTSAFFFKDKDIKLSDIGRELNVDHVLEGSVRKSGTKIRVTAQLIETETDAHLWSETWDRDLDDVFVIQDEIAKAVVDELRVQLLGDLPHALATDGEAYSLFLQARHTINQRTYDSLMRGEELVQQALELEPNYAPAWVLKAFIQSQQGDVGALYQVSVYYAFTGNFDEALRLALKTHELDPLHIPNHATLGYIYNIQGEYDKAISILEKRIAIAPGSFGSYAYLANPYILKGDYDKALEYLQQEWLDGFKYAGLAITYAHSGDQAASDETLAELMPQNEGGWDRQIVQAHAARGELDAAFAAMDLAYENRDSGLQLILGDRHIDNLRDDPRFEAMLDKLGIRQ